MSGPITKSAAPRAVRPAERELKQADQRGELYIVGGAMMALAHDARRVTEDIDSHIRRGRDAVTRAVAEIADEEGLSSTG